MAIFICIVNRAAMNTDEQVPMEQYTEYMGYIPIDSVDESCSRAISSFGEKHP